MGSLCGNCQRCFTVVVVASTVLPSAEMSLITLILHHHGYFDQGPPTRYVGGIKDVYSRWVPDMLSYPTVKKLLNELGYSSFNKCVYLYPRIRYTDTDEGEYSNSGDEADIDVDMPKEGTISLDNDIDAPQKRSFRAEHRFCMRHLWSNYSKDYKGKELKDAMWACARATTSQQFEKCMLDVKNLSDGAWRWLNRLDPKVWSRHAFRILPKNWSLTSNMCEQFNAKIAKYRAKPVLTMAEEIRCKVMRKITKEKEKMMQYHGPIVPKVQNKLEKTKRESRFWTPVWAGDREGAKYEVQCLPHKYDINLSTRSCSCNEWDLTGVPCVHAIAALGYNNLKPEDFVHPYYSKETFLRVYDSFIKPANGAAMWPQAEGDPVQPPPLKRPPGRPKR
ncbi:uncharacterized protein G2W53_016225 [Senna tora]|uniref:SWIM-type domain-containing protein n=1 Tax=Senna tora TaxID=362788 RepID=A0A834TQE5_9FABA|nr:uncharacterized protein G2W53_016225 [Senna tora]